MPEPDCFLRYRMLLRGILRRENSTYTYWRPAAAVRRGLPFQVCVKSIWPQTQWHDLRAVFHLWPWTTATATFKVTLFFDAEYLRNRTTYRHSFNEIGLLIGVYTRPIQQCHFEWSWVTLSDLAKYPMTRSVARSLCDSWAFCFIPLAFDAPFMGVPVGILPSRLVWEN